MAVTIRTVTDDELAAFRLAILTTFGADDESDLGGLERLRALIDPARRWAAFDGATVVATAATFDLEASLPGGGALPFAGLTMVTVRPTHRRRGLLRALVAAHLEDARVRGRAASALWASEASIYGRFGYGIAAYSHAVEIEQAHQLRLELADPDELEPIDEARAREVLPAIYARAIAERPGALRRSPAWWRERRFVETPWHRGGASARRHVIARRGDELVGYLVYRQRGGFTSAVLPGGRVEINELVAIDPRATATLWKFALAVDLFPTVTWWNAPIDDPLPWLVDDMRRVQRRRMDTLWLRLEDLPAALAARAYPVDGTLRLAIAGDPATYELVVEGGRASCTPTRHAPELRLDRPSLGALYLGGTPASHLSRARLVEASPAILAVADRLFASTLAPWCPEIF
jgi:predicted acetyltransferase